MNNVISLLSLVILILTVGACKDDPPPKSTVEFETVEMEIKESDGTTSSVNPLILTNGVGQIVTVLLKFDRPMAETSVIAITVGGTAIAETTTNNGYVDYNDYKFVSDDKNVIVQKGDDFAEITLTVFEDYNFEMDSNGNPYETITITLSSVVSGTAIIGTNDTFTLTIHEDDAVVFLDWNAGGGTIGDVDMDTYLYLDGVIVRGSAGVNDSQNFFEAFNIPAGYPTGNYGITYTYYSGTSNTLTFYSTLYNLGGTLNGGTYTSLDAAGLQFTGTYTTSNINPFDGKGNGTDPIIVQTMSKSGYNYSNISSITSLANSSRIASGSSSEVSLPAFTIEKGKVSKILKLIKK